MKRFYLFLSVLVSFSMLYLLYLEASQALHQRAFARCQIELENLRQETSAIPSCLEVNRRNS